MKYLVTIETVGQARDIVLPIFALNGVTKVDVIPTQELMLMEPDDRLEYIDRMLGLSSES
jgi:hypothetical protein